MSDWTTVTNKKNNPVVPLVNFSHKQRKQMEWEASQKEKRDKWIDEYNREFPPLSDAIPEPPDEYKINFIRQRNKTRYEEYKARENERSKEKRERYEHLERVHAEECERILGKQWYRHPMLIGSDFDCELADVMRYEDDLEQQTADWEAEFDKLEYERKQTEQERKERENQIDGSEYSYCKLYNDANQLMNWIRSRDAELSDRWAKFLESNAKKPPHRVWNATKMKELLK